MAPSIICAASWWGPSLCAGGALSLLLAFWYHGIKSRTTVFSISASSCRDAPLFWERISVHLVAYGIWGLGFGAIIWRGVPVKTWDLRFDFEINWKVFESAEWIYLSVYFVPALMPWLAPTRDSLQKYALTLLGLLFVSLPFFLLVPIASVPKAFSPSSLAGQLLLWDASRSDFAAASFPSFHVFWGLLVARLLQPKGRCWAIAGWMWALSITVSCIATGVHALADVVASWILFPFVSRASMVAHVWVARFLNR